MSLYIRKEFQTLQSAIDSGSIWSMEGSAGRGAMRAIENGDVVLGTLGRLDYYGNYIPSRSEVHRGTKGSIAYARKVRAIRRDDWDDEAY